MKPVPFILLLASVLLASHGRPSAVWTPSAPRDQALLSAAAADLLGDALLRLLRGGGGLSPGGSDSEAQMDSTALYHLARAVAFLETDLHAAGVEGEHGEHRVDELGEGGLSKRGGGAFRRSEEPPISIDLTFHLLRNMIHMARVEREKEQAEMNRHFLDEMGK